MKRLFTVREFLRLMGGAAALPAAAKAQMPLKGVGVYPTSSGAALYDGFAATHNLLPTNLSPATAANVRSGHWARANITKLKILVPNYYGQSETAPGAPMLVTASVESPAGTLTQILFGGSATGTAGNGSTLFSDFLTIAIPSGERFWIRLHQTCTAGLVYIAVGTYNNDHPEHMGDAYEISTTDRTMTGEVPSPDSGTIAYLPTVIAPTTAPTLMIVGDSIDYGVTDVLDVFGDLGIICRSVGSKFGYFNVSQPGETASGFVSTHTQRLLGLPFCTHVFAGHGTNDIFAGDSKATIEGNLTTVYGLFSTKTVFGRTIVPRTTGPWTTTAAQAVLAGESVRTTLNTDLLSTFHPGGGVFNVGAVNEVTGGKWSAPPATTDDGIHPNQLGYANIASSGAINTALIGTPAAPASDTGSAWGDHGTLITVSTSRRTNDTAYPTDVGNPNTTVRGATGNSSGLKYFELEMLGGGASGNPRSQILGLMTITTANGAPLDDYIGNINDSFGITDGAAYFFVSGTIFSAVNTSAVSFFAGDFFGWNLDFTNKFGYMHRNGVYLTGSGGVPGNPNSGATGTGHVVSWTGTPTLYPAATLYGATNLPPRPVRIRTVQFLRALTGSYTAWG